MVFDKRAFQRNRDRVGGGGRHPRGDLFCYALRCNTAVPAEFRYSPPPFSSRIRRALRVLATIGPRGGVLARGPLVQNRRPLVFM